MARKRTNTLSDAFLADIRETNRRVLGRGLDHLTTPYTPGATQKDVWLKITAHELDAGIWKYTVDTYTAALLAGTNARTKTGQKARNATPAGPIAVGQWVRSLGRELVAGEWIHVFSQPTGIFPVKVTVDGGSAGSDTTTCNFTYTIDSVDGVEIATGVTPLQYRSTNVEYHEPAADSYGLAFFDGTSYVLYNVVEEYPLDEPC